MKLTNTLNISAKKSLVGQFPLWFVLNESFSILQVLLSLFNDLLVTVDYCNQQFTVVKAGGLSFWLRSLQTQID